MRDERGVGAHAVVLPVADDHAAIEAQLTGAPRRHHLDFRRKEVGLLDAVLVGQKLQRERLHRLLRGVFALRALGALARVFTFRTLAVEGKRAVADEDI